MNRLLNAFRILVLTSGCLLLLLAPASAQTTNSASLEANGTGSSIQIAVSLDIGGTLPTDWTGWIVDRSTVGNCADPVVQVGEVMEFPASHLATVLHDYSAEAGITYMYRLFAVDALGGRHALPGLPDWPPGYYFFDYASVSSDGVVAEGTLVDLGWSTSVATCAGGCWTYVAFISDLPPELTPFVGTELVIRLFGTLAAEFEGPYVEQVTGWEYMLDCAPVATLEKSWGAVKAQYR